MNTTIKRVTLSIIAFLVVFAFPGLSTGQVCSDGTNILLEAHGVTIPDRLDPLTPGLLQIPLTLDPTGSDDRGVQILIKFPYKGRFYNHRDLRLRWTATIADVDGDTDFELLIFSLEPFSRTGVTVLVTE